MDYYKLFNLEKEPFSNTPDPDFFYRSTMHTKCLMDLEIALRLRRGLCIVHGKVGTGKTTLCRQMIRILADNDEIRMHFVLDPNFDSPERFAIAISEMLCGPDKTNACKTIGDHREMIKQSLFEAGVDQGKIIILVIDEAQKLPGACIEFLRELLNYETNEHKLLQIVLFAQSEIEDLLAAHPNFEDRVAFYHHLGPLSRSDTAKLIRFRLQKAAGQAKQAVGPVFTARGIARIHHLTGGYPRKIIHLTHNILLLLIIKGKNRVTPSIVEQAAKSVPSVKNRSRVFKMRRGLAFAATGLMIAVVAAGFVTFSTLSGPVGNPQAHVSVDVMAVSPEDQGGREAFPDPTVVVDEYAQSPARSHVGEIRIRKNENLWRILERVYGNDSGNALENIKNVNPGMVNPHVVQPGQVVVFPLLRKRGLASGEHYWVALEKAGDLETAYRFLVDAPVSDLRLASFRMPAGELMHAVVKGISFEDPESAGMILAGLPPHIRDASTVLDLTHSGVRLVNLN